MNWELITTLTSIMLFAYWLNYIMGGPLSDDEKRIDVRAILFFIPYALTIRRLKIAGVYKSHVNSLTESLTVTTDPKTRVQLKKDAHLDMLLYARALFTWERSLLCPICLHFWLTILVGIVFILFDIMHARADFLLAVIVYLANHLFIRKIS